MRTFDRVECSVDGLSIMLTLQETDAVEIVDLMSDVCLVDRHQPKNPQYASYG